MKLFCFCVIFIIGLIKINGECTLNFNSRYSPIFVPYEGNEFLVISPNYITFGQHNYIYAVCPSGFRIEYKGYSFNHDDQDSNSYNDDDQVVLLKCINKETKIERDNKLFPMTRTLNCKDLEHSEVFEGLSIKNCDKKSYTINLNIRNVSIDFADICFDTNNMRIDFLHYVTKKLNLISFNQFDYNENLQFLKKSEAPAEIFFIDESQADNLIQNITGYEYNFLKFKYAEFYPTNYWHMYNPLSNARTLNRFLGWTNFIEGNWRLFRNLLMTRSENVIYDVYLGTSDVVVVPSYADCNSLKKLHLKGNNTKFTTSVPKYVWSYLKSKENKSDEFVVIGINSPYFEFFPRNESIFCDDICHEIDWFSPLEKFRKMSSFGYMFCCRKEQVQNILDGFPDVQPQMSITTIPSVDDDDDQDLDVYIMNPKNKK